MLTFLCYCGRERAGSPAPSSPEPLVRIRAILLYSWYELAAVGALLLAIAGAAGALLIFLLPVSTQPFATGAFAAFAIVGAFAWGAIVVYVRRRIFVDLSPHLCPLPRVKLSKPFEI